MNEQQRDLAKPLYLEALGLLYNVIVVVREDKEKDQQHHMTHVHVISQFGHCGRGSSSHPATNITRDRRVFPPQVIAKMCSYILYIHYYRT